jgi:CRP-like cAMP-binding protein
MRVAVFADLDPADVQTVAEMMRERTYHAGDTVIAEGASGDGFFVVESGEAEVTVHGQPQGTIEPGDCFGEIALLTGSERAATITATSDLRCYSLTPAEFRTVVEGNPTIAWQVYQSMVHWGS